MYEISEEDFNLWKNERAAIFIKYLNDPEQFAKDFPIIDGVTLDDKFNLLFNKMNINCKGFKDFYKAFGKQYPYMVVDENYVALFPRIALEGRLKGKKILYPKIENNIFDI